jgi:hypothetical protein
LGNLFGGFGKSLFGGGRERSVRRRREGLFGGAGKVCSAAWATA